MTTQQGITPELIPSPTPTPSSKHVFIVYESNWADEMDVMGTFIDTEESWEVTKESVRKFFTKYPDRELTHSVGTNEEITYGSYQSWEGCYTLYPIPSQEVLEFLKGVEGLSGRFYWPEWYDEEEEDDGGTAL